MENHMHGSFFRSKMCIIFISCLLCKSLLYGQPQEQVVKIIVTPDHPDWVYNVGEEVNASFPHDKWQYGDPGCRVDPPPLRRAAGSAPPRFRADIFRSSGSWRKEIWPDSMRAKSSNSVTIRPLRSDSVLMVWAER